MTEKTPTTGAPALDDRLADALVRSRRFFTKGYEQEPGSDDTAALHVGL